MNQENLENIRASNEQTDNVVLNIEIQLTSEQKDSIIVYRN